MLQSVFRMLRQHGRFVMTNICPRQMLDWPYYHYFPAALTADLGDFLPMQEIADLMEQTGFVNVNTNLTYVTIEQTLDEFSQTAHQRSTCSQLMTPVG